MVRNYLPVGGKTVVYQTHVRIGAEGAFPVTTASHFPGYSAHLKGQHSCCIKTDTNMSAVPPLPAKIAKNITNAARNAQRRKIHDNLCAKFTYNEALPVPGAS
jgi:hypothetical protein